MKILEKIFGVMDFLTVYFYHLSTLIWTYQMIRGKYKEQEKRCGINYWDKYLTRYFFLWTLRSVYNHFFLILKICKESRRW